jgi:hypothetical protein
MDESLPKASLLDGYRFTGFWVRARIKQRVRDPNGLVIVLARRQKNDVWRVRQSSFPLLRP